MTRGFSNGFKVTSRAWQGHKVRREGSGYGVFRCSNHDVSGKLVAWFRSEQEAEQLIHHFSERTDINARAATDIDD